MHFAATVYNAATGSVVGTFLGILGIKAANTTGHRARLRSLVVGGAAGAAQDIQVALRLVRSNNTSDGTKTDVTVTKKDADSLAANLTAAGPYTANPTTLESTFVWEGSINGRGVLVMEWSDDDAPVVQKNQTLLLQGSPGITTAVTLAATMEFEEF